MKRYEINPLDGASKAYLVLHPNTNFEDFIEWYERQDCSDDDPRLLLYALANLCDSALDVLLEQPSGWSPVELSACVAGALSHYETSIRAYTAVFGHRRFEKLAKLSPVEALKVCLPSEVDCELLI